MSYKVTGAAAVVELDDGNPELGTGKRVYLDHGVPVPAEVKAAHIEHLLNAGLIAEADIPAEAKPETPAEPEPWTHEQWVAHAVAHGATEADAEAATDEELATLYPVS